MKNIPFIVLPICLAFSISSQAAPEIDQAQTNHSGGTNNLNAINRFAQTFTVGLEGKFLGVDLWMEFYGNDPDVTVSIQPLGPNGFPDDSIILGQKTLSGSALVGPAARAVYFDLEGANLFVEPGDELAIVISSTDNPPQTGDLALLYWGVGALYSGGREVRTWNTSNGQPCGWCANDGRDMYFTTYVDTELLPVVVVDVDIKPGSYPNSINLSSGGSTPVAILGSPELDVNRINTDSLTLGTSGVKTVGKKNKSLCSIEDVSGDFSQSNEGAPDGHLDLVCQFITIEVVPEDGNTIATVNGNFYDGTALEGADTVNIVP
ncbi:MAG: hypothetical protein R3208_14370 [Ketobacteraceae bacterium]|nr:hypothetical protein [Ketobacteraceae bacterium]